MSTRPVPSNLPEDLLFNAQKLDEAVNSGAATYLDRLGVARLTLAGAAGSIASINPRGDWAAATDYALKDVVKAAGTWYVCLSPHTSSAAFATDQDVRWRVYQGLLASEVTNVVDARLDFGAAIDGTTDDLGALNAALAAPHRQLFVQEGDVLVSADPTDMYGPEIGPGRVLKPIVGGKQQLNSYADLHKYAIGKEYLYRVYQRLIVGGTIKSFAYGDSTVAGGYVDPKLEINVFLNRLATQKGLKSGFNVFNQGVGGSQVGSLNAIPDLAADTDLFIIKYGINDGTNSEATRLNTFATALRAKLSAIRAASFGSVYQLSILLVGPNATSDTPNGRDERWYEQLRGVFVRAARDFKCAYFDTYAYLKDARGAAGYWLTDDFSDGRGIHPKDTMQAWIWGGVFDWMFGQSESAPWRTNHFLNLPGAAFLTLGATEPPNSFEMGQSFFRVLPANGWPLDGVVFTSKHSDGVVIQELTGYVGPSTKVYRRTSVTASNTWTPWSGQRLALTLQNGWVTFGGVYDLPIAVRADSGQVTVSMTIKSGSVAAGTVLANLPLDMRPFAQTPPVGCVVNGVPGGAVEVNTNGDIVVRTAINATQTGILFTFWAV